MWPTKQKRDVSSTLKVFILCLIRAIIFQMQYLRLGEQVILFNVIPSLISKGIHAVLRA